MAGAPKAVPPTIPALSNYKVLPIGNLKRRDRHVTPAGFLRQVLQGHERQIMDVNVHHELRNPLSVY